MVWKLSQIRVIEGQFVPREPKLVRVIGSFENSRVREIGGKIVELDWSKSKGNKVWFEILGGSGNWGFEKSGNLIILYLSVDTFFKRLVKFEVCKIYWQPRIGQEFNGCTVKCCLGVGEKHQNSHDIQLRTRRVCTLITLMKSKALVSGFSFF